MAGNFVEEFIVGLGFEFSGEEGERFKKQTEQISSALNALTTAAAAATAALFANAKLAGDNADAAGKTAKQLDTSVESLGKWRYAAEKAGSSGEALNGMLLGLKNASQEAMRSGTGPFRAFAELGVDFQGIADGSVDVTKALDDIIAKAQTLDRATGQQALKEIGIDPKFLDTSIEELHKFMAEYEKYGHFTTNLSHQGEALNDALDSTGVRLEGIRNMLAERTIPTYIKFFDVVSKGLEWVQEKGFPILDEFVEKVGGWDKVLGGLALVGIPAVIGGLGSLLGMLGLVSKGFAAASASAALLAKGGLVGLAGYAGWKAGGQINEMLPDDVKNQIGEYMAKSLAFLGVQEAKDAVEINNPKDPNAPGYNHYGGLLSDVEDNMRLQDDYEQAKREHPEDYPTPKPFVLPVSPLNTDGSKLLNARNAPLLQAIIGRESGGQTGLTSGKGASGLAQLMEPTARETAADLGIEFDKEKLLHDAEYNKMLGGAYLQKLLAKYGGQEELAVAAYNAGPGMVDDWMTGGNKTGKNQSGLKLGDPRNGGVSTPDWIKGIPFKETRDYTQNVLADKASISPVTPVSAPVAPVPGAASGTKTINNTFHGLKQSEIEDILRQAEEEQQTLAANEARDSLVR